MNNTAYNYWSIDPYIGSAVMLLNSGVNSDQARGVVQKTIPTESSISTPPKSNSWRAMQFGALYTALRSMVALPEGHDFHIDQQTAKRAEELLGLISKNLEIKAPKIFPQDGEALVMTWDLGNLKRYLTIAGPDVDLMDLNKKIRVRCERSLSADGDLEYEKLISELGISPQSQSVAIGGDAR